MLPNTRIALDRRLIVAALLAAGAIAAVAEPPVPWPRGQAPLPRELDERISAAVDLYELERWEEFLEAAEAGEDSEHTFVLQEWIDEGRLELERLFVFGDATFAHEFRRLDGYGRSAAPRLARVHDGAYGGLDTFSCAGCHAMGGVNGAGSATATSFYFGDGASVSSAVKRNPPAVLGLGFVQALGVEMSSELALVRDTAIARAAREGQAVTAPLSSKGVSFGRITVEPDGRIDFSELEGVDEDLVVKPFGWKGHTARLRRFGERAARIHFGIQSHVLALDWQEDPDIERLGAGPNWYDPDGDGRARELEEGTVTALAVYMAMLEAPVLIPPTEPRMLERWSRGSALFDRLGCSDCHRRTLLLNAPEWAERSDTTGGKPVAIDLAHDGEKPRGDPQHVQLFSDLRRHDMGADLADAFETGEGVRASAFLTRPLWGLAETPPYLHDGRAPTIPDAILAHGGEAALQRASFEALSADEKADLHVFLLSLTREPRLRFPQ